MNQATRLAVGSFIFLMALVGGLRRGGTTVLMQGPGYRVIGRAEVSRRYRLQPWCQRQIVT